MGRLSPLATRLFCRGKLKGVLLVRNGSTKVSARHYEAILPVSTCGCWVNQKKEIAQLEARDSQVHRRSMLNVT